GLARNDVHHRGLARAVRADDGAHLAGRERERQIVDGMEAVEGHVHAVEIEQGGSRAGVHDVHALTPPFWGSLTPSSRAALTAAGAGRRALNGSQKLLKVPTMPLGKSSVTRMNIAPSMNSQ